MTSQAEQTPVELRIGGRTYRVIASANEDTLHRLASSVDRKLREHSSASSINSPQALLLAAISLAHDLEQEQSKRQIFEQQTKAELKQLLGRIDQLTAQVVQTFKPSNHAAKPGLVRSPSLPEVASAASVAPHEEQGYPSGALLDIQPEINSGAPAEAERAVAASKPEAQDGPYLTLFEEAGDEALGDELSSEEPELVPAKRSGVLKLWPSNSQTDAKSPRR